MNCKHIQELLPLFVGHDLEADRAQMVSAHIESCAECAGSASEYRQSRQLLQQFAPPPFSEEVFTGIRQHVLREIRREAAAPGLSRLLQGLFRPRLRWAVATALVLAVCVSALYFVANRGNDRGKVAGVQPKASPQRPDATASSSPSIPVPGGNDGLPLKSSGRNNSADTANAGSGEHTHPSRRRERLGTAADQLTAVAVNTPDSESISAEALSERKNLAESNAVTVSDPTVSEKTLRVEMQTKDPNIRIIWFAHEPVKQDSPSKSSKGT